MEGAVLGWFDEEVSAGPQGPVASVGAEHPCYKPECVGRQDAINYAHMRTGYRIKTDVMPRYLSLPEFVSICKRRLLACSNILTVNIKCLMANFYIKHQFEINISYPKLAK